MVSSYEPDVFPSRLDECETALGYQFRDRSHLELALTHASAARTRLLSNERLEFLGDAILGCTICEVLYRRYPEATEGELTRLKSSLVSRNTCADVCTAHGFERFLVIGKGLAGQNPLPTSILANVVESLIAAVALDGTREDVYALIERLLDAEIERVALQEHLKNFKSMLQQLSQKSFNETPVYHLLDEKGPDHSKCFKVCAVIGSQRFSSAWGASKKEAEQRAACNALHEIEGKEPPFVTD